MRLSTADIEFLDGLMGMTIGYNQHALTLNDWIDLEKSARIVLNPEGEAVEIKYSEMMQFRNTVSIIEQLPAVNNNKQVQATKNDTSIPVPTQPYYVDPTIDQFMKDMTLDFEDYNRILKNAMNYVIENNGNEQAVQMAKTVSDLVKNGIELQAGKLHAMEFISKVHAIAQKFNINLNK